MDTYTQAVSTQKGQGSGKVFGMMLAPKIKGAEDQPPPAPLLSTSFSLFSLINH
jgi:hypothetical protein